MIAGHVAASDALAYIRTTTAFIVPMREKMARFGNGFMSLDDAAWFRASLDEMTRLRVEGERLSESFPVQEFVELVDILRSAETSYRAVEASMRPVLAS